MTLYFEQHESSSMRGPARRMPSGGDHGIDQTYYGGPPLSTAPRWQTNPQEWQPPALRYYQRIAGILPGDAADLNDRSSPILVPFKEGWAVQPYQPQAARSGLRVASAALARGDDGMVAVFVAPWTMAARATSFPDFQNDPRAAIPIYQAGPQVGAINSMPNITGPTLLKGAPGSLLSITVITAGSTVGGLYDVAGYSALTAYQFGVIPTTATGIPITYDWPCQKGILIVPGTGQVVAAKWT